MTDLQKLLAEATPGPWVAIASIPLEGWDGWTIHAQPHSALRGFTHVLADVIGPQGDPDREANARLIAMAPDLAAALVAASKALHFYADSHDNPDKGPWGHGGDDFGAVATKALQDINSLTGAK